jgi:hypothetical protein
MSSLFTTGVDQGVRYVAVDGSHWGSRDEAQKHTGLELAIRAYGRARLDEISYGYTLFSNLRRVTDNDIAPLIAILDDYLQNIRPEFEAYTGLLGWHGGKRYFLTTEDGDTHDDKIKAAKHVLLLRFRQASKKFSPALVKALSNGEPEPVSSYKLERIFRSFLDARNADAPCPFSDNEERFRDALVTMTNGRRTVPDVHRPK